ncbi:unnamed protein product [Angiostrongylus costaricensis]|uniref:Zn_Tnp_IS1 domain-containing protein n=1 Tax=Angiostrongylus costaricensis TaxID=334426 RepID=A0A0R3PFU6_ANGCS|nr:unnamed protein product [Angiostrongylus costaricensis]
MPLHVQCARCEVAVKIRRGAERKASEVVSASMTYSFQRYPLLI